jgi:formylglycine-generating enzyme required for sulfatase activity
MPRGQARWRASDLTAFVQDELAKAGLPKRTFDAVQEAWREFGGLFFFDGLDEAPDAATRVHVLQAVIEFSRTTGAHSRVLVTSRPYGWRDIEEHTRRSPELAEVIAQEYPNWPLGEFDAGQIGTFISRWFQAVEKVDNLQQAVRREEYLKLARNPLLLTLMATLLGNRMRLPQDRADLYDAVADLLLFRWNEVIGLDRGLLDALQIPTLKMSDLRETLEHVAIQAHAAQEGREGNADIPEAALVAELRLLLEDRPEKAERALDYIEQRSGLLLGQGPRRGLRQYAFPHRTFQEFLAGCHLARQADLNDQVINLAERDPWHWREVLRFAARRAGATRGVPAADGLVHRQDVSLWCQENAPTMRDWERAVLAGEQLLEIGLAGVSRQDQDRTIRKRITWWLARLVGEGHLPVRDRAAAGITLGTLGDPRPGVGLSTDGAPDIAWVEIPAGEFLMGEQRQPVSIPRRYRISKYPVTVMQYQAFVAAGGYAEEGRRYWTEAGWAWKQSPSIEGPEDHTPVFQTANHPRVGVSWYEAVAFGRWLGERLGLQVSLPTEAQWERAARHTDGREYPWGEWNEEEVRCNTPEAGIGHTSAVGMFPAGDAVSGAADMAGNVWEWCRTKYDRPGDDNLEGVDARVLRGGSRFNNRSYARCASRLGFHPGIRFDLNGFRLVASPSFSDSVL